MNKKFKHILTVLTLLAMLFSMSTSVFAINGTAALGGDGNGDTVWTGVINPTIIGTPIAIDVTGTKSGDESIQPVWKWNSGVPTISTLNNKFAYTNLNAKITDDSGTQAGWRLQVSASALTEKAPVGGFLDGDQPIVLPNGVLSFSSLPLISNAHVGITGITSSYTLDQAIDNGVVTVAKAAANSGAGVTDVSFDGYTFGATLPQVQKFAQQKMTDSKYYPDGNTPYESTVTWTIVVGP